MKALARFGKAFGGYKMIDVPQPMCGPEDVVIEIKAAAICGADMIGGNRSVRLVFCINSLGTNQ